MIKRQNGYSLKKINEVYTLLPYGQIVADQKRGITINETGVFLWNALREHKEEAELVRLTAEHYGITDSSEMKQLQEDIPEFLNQLKMLGILRTGTDSVLKEEGIKCCGGMEIAGIRIGFFGEKELIPELFQDFMTDAERTDGDAGYWDQKIEFVEHLPENRQNGTVLLRNKELVISEWEEGYIAEFPTLDNVYEAYMTEDGSYVRIYCRKPCGKEERENLFHAIRLFFLYLAQRRGYYAVHSASVLYGDRAWLFSGHSGMGKSTHTAMWHELAGTPYLNGDLNLVGEKDGKLVVSGIPWCGTSGIYTTKEYELGGIVLLGRDSRDHVEPLSGYEKTVRVMQRMISPVWKESLLEKNLAFAEKIAGNVPVLHLLCTKEPSAVETVRREIDRLRSSGK